MLLMPDILLMLLPFAVLMADLFFNRRHTHRPAFHVTWMGLVAVFATQCLVPHDSERVFLNAWRVAPWPLLFKQLFVVAALLTAWLAEPYFCKEGNKRGRLARGGEFYSLLVFCTAGMSAVVSAQDLITLFVGLEMATIPLYVLTAFYRGEEESAEAAMKYIVMGSLSTAIILFGYSFIYGASGVVHFKGIAEFAAAHPDDLLLRAGALLAIAAVGFKLAMVPFHMWAPDVYHGAPTPVTAFIASGSKTAAIGFLVLLFTGPLEPLRPALGPLFSGLAAISMFVGNLGALKQRNLRRFMAYSSIAQVGYILLAFLSAREILLGSLMYYLGIYLAGNMAAFFVFSLVGRNHDETLDGLHGLSRSNPGLAAVLMLAMFSLAGVPPLAGFTGKFLLFSSAAETGHYGLLLFAALNSVASLYYYMIVIKEAYIVQPSGEPVRLPVARATSGILLLLAVAMVVLGLWPAFHDIAFRAASF